MPSGAKVVSGKGPPVTILDLRATTLVPIRTSRNSPLLGLAVFTLVFVFPHFSALSVLRLCYLEAEFLLFEHQARAG